MTIGYINFKPVKSGLDELRKISEINNYLKDLFKEVDACKDNIVYPLAARLIRYSCPFITKFLTDFDAAVKNAGRAMGMGSSAYPTATKLGNAPVIIKCPSDPFKVRVFPNLTLDYSKLDVADRISIYFGHDTIRGLMNTYNEDMKGEMSKIKWETLHRTKKRLLKFEDVSIQRAINRHMPFINNAELIKRIDLEYIEMVRPIEIQYTNSPEDFIEMYGDGPSSCMNHNSGDANRAWAFMLELKTHPTAFYHYMGAKGAFIKKKGKIVARTIIFDMEGKSKYGRVYGVDDQAKTKFIQLLEQANIKQLAPESTDNTKYKPSMPKEFKIPGIKIKGSAEDYLMPLPYFDNVPDTIRASFLEETKEFLVTISKNNDMVPVKNERADGYVRSSAIKTVRCKACEKPVAVNHARITTEDGIIYCSEKCVGSHNYVAAIRSDGSTTYRLKELCLEAYTHKNTFFTNADSAYRNGYRPVVDNIDELRLYSKKSRKNIFEFTKKVGVTKNQLYLDKSDTFVMPENKFWDWLKEQHYLRPLSSGRYCFDENYRAEYLAKQEELKRQREQALEHSKPKMTPGHIKIRNIDANGVGGMYGTVNPVAINTVPTLTGLRVEMDADMNEIEPDPEGN